MKRFLILLAFLPILFPVLTWGGETRPLIELDRKVLSKVKRAVRRGNAEYVPAYRQLIADADKILSEGPYSVVTKKQVPPSGDKRDYVSQGTYWWPNPKKPDGLPYVRKDGLTNPEIYDYPDSRNLDTMSRSVYKLGLAYYFSGEEKYASHAARLLRVWFLDEGTRMNPNLNYGQRVPGVCEGRGTGLIDTRTFAEMLDAVVLIGSSKAWSKADDDGLKAWFKEFTDWMLTSPNGKQEARQHNNHGTYYDLQIVAYSIFAGQTELAKKQLQEVTLRRLDSQLAPDGEQPYEMARTLPWAYCSMNLMGFLELALAGEKIGVDLWDYETPDGASIRKAIEWFFPFLSGEKPWPKPEVTGQRNAKYLAAVLMMGSRYDPAGYKEQLDRMISFTGDDFDLETSVLKLTYPMLKSRRRK